MDWPSTAELQDLLDRSLAAEKDAEKARDELIARAYERLLRLARKMFHDDFPRLKHKHDTSSVLHGAYLGLSRAIRDVQPASVCHFFRLAAKHIRWTLLKLAEQDKKNGERIGIADKEGSPDANDGGPIDDSPGPVETAMLNELLGRYPQFPEEQQLVIDLHLVTGLNQKETAKLMDVSQPTVSKLKWRVLAEINRWIWDIH